MQSCEDLSLLGNRLTCDFGDLLTNWHTRSERSAAWGEPFDTSTPSGRLLFNVLGSIAEFERDLVVERTKAGVAAARRRGAHIGRPEVTDRRLRERILRLRRVGGMSLREIATLVEVSASTVARVVKAAPEGSTAGRAA